jgi:hypothetical protein
MEKLEIFKLVDRGECGFVVILFGEARCVKSIKCGVFDNRRVASRATWSHTSKRRTF